MKYGLEAKSNSGKWIKFRSGSRQGPQVCFSNVQEARDWLDRSGLMPSSYRVVQVMV